MNLSPKDIATIILLFIVSCFFLFSFAFWTVDPGLWPYEGRVFFCFIQAAWLTLVSVYVSGGFKNF